MGYYIECPQNTQKAEQILQKYKEVHEVKEPYFDYSCETFMVCVVENGPFDAAAIAYSPEILEVYKQNDGRPKRWLVAPRKLIVALCPMVKNELY